MNLFCLTFKVLVIVVVDGDICPTLGSGGSNEEHRKQLDSSLVLSLLTLKYLLIRETQSLKYKKIDFSL